MVSIYHYSDKEIQRAQGLEQLEKVACEHIFWIDMQFPLPDEIKKIETLFALDTRQLQEENQLESTARFYEAEDLVFLCANFITMNQGNFESTPVYLYLLEDVLISERAAELTSFDETIKKMFRNKKAFQSGSDVLEGILETKVDVDSDFIENLAREIASIGRKLSIDNTTNKEELLYKISDLQEATTLSRESFIDKQRVVSALLKCSVIKDKDRFRMLIKDINAMLEYTNFIFMRLEFLQNTVLGLIDIDQNKTTKIFTIVAVVFMPPTLIASIYGMNFHRMPELSWEFGYPLAISLIVASSLITLLLFKLKKWI